MSDVNPPTNSAEEPEISVFGRVSGVLARDRRDCPIAPETSCSAWSPSLTKVCRRRLPRCVTWCGMPRMTTRPNRAMLRSLSNRSQFVNQGMVSPNPDPGAPHRQGVRSVPSSREGSPDSPALFVHIAQIWCLAPFSRRSLERMCRRKCVRRAGRIA